MTVAYPYYGDDELDKDVRICENIKCNIKSEVLAVIHAYDETAESKLSRIWKILGEEA